MLPGRVQKFSMLRQRQLQKHELIKLIRRTPHNGGVFLYQKPNGIRLKTMHRSSTLFFFPAAFILLTAFVSIKTDQDKLLRKDGFVFIPSGSTIINGDTVTIQGFYMLDHEVTNAEYRKFLEAMQTAHDSVTLATARIDTEAWRLPNAYMEPFVNYYHKHPAYDSYPVVNIGQDGARAYCHWLEGQYAAEGIQVKVRLPEEAEWIYAAKGGHEENMYAWDGTELRNRKGAYLANFWTTAQSMDGSMVTAISKSYFPNGYKLYNMCGNVSEWISPDALSKGGNWHSEEKFLRIDAPQEFGNTMKGSPFIGFRPVITRSWNK